MMKYLCKPENLNKKGISYIFEKISMWLMTNQGFTIYPWVSKNKDFFLELQQISVLKID